MTSYPNNGSKTLFHAHRRMLFEGSGIDPGVARERGYYTARKRSEVPEAFKNYQKRPGLLIPVLTPSGERRVRLRPDRPRKGKDGRVRKYEQAGGVGCVLDVHPRNLERLMNPAVPLWVVEGEKKGDALTSRGECAIALPGVWNWQRSGEMLPDWDYVALTDRTVYVCFDSDAWSNPNVQMALERLVGALEGRGAEVLVVHLEDKPDGSKVGADDFLVAGGTVAELKLLARKFVAEDIGHIRLSRDEKLRAAASDLWGIWRAYDWMRFVGAGENPNWQRGHTVRDVIESLLELMERHGKLNGHGVVVRASHRTLVEMSAKSRPSVRAALKHAEAEGLLEILDSEGDGKARSYRLLTRSAAFYHKDEKLSARGNVTQTLQRCDPGGKGLRAPTASRLRWSSPARKVQRLRGITPGTLRVRQTPRFHKDITVKESREHFPDEPYVKRLGPHRCAVVDVVEDAGGELHLEDLCEVLHRKRPRDVRRRILKPIEEAGVIEVDGEVIRLTADWIARLEEERERKGEVSQAQKQREKHRKQRERYRDYLKSVKQLPSRASREAVKRAHEARETGFAAERERATAAAKAEEQRKAEAFVRDRLRELGRIRLALLQDIWRDEGGDAWTIPQVVKAMGYRVEELPEFDNRRFVFPPLEGAA
jgi:hypothetical protein